MEIKENCQVKFFMKKLTKFIMSKIKIKAGFLKGKNIYVPDFIRPTQDKVKKGIFDILENKVINSIFLDLFAGSGNIGIEAISRGAKFCYFVEKSQKCIEVIKKNIRDLKIEDKTKIIKIDAEKFVKKSEEKFNVIFADPPYNYKIKREFIINTLNILKEGLLILEISKRNKLNEINDLIKREVNYGETKILFFGNLSG